MEHFTKLDEMDYGTKYVCPICAEILSGDKMDQWEHMVTRHPEVIIGSIDWSVEYDKKNNCYNWYDCPRFSDDDPVVFQIYPLVE